MSTNATAKRFVPGSLGTVTVPKGTPKGSYQVTIRVTYTAAKSETYISSHTDVSFKINVG